MVDLHTHSAASDGSLSPSDLIAKAEKLGLSALALTDHDTIGGLDDAARTARERGIGFIPGIELEITRDPGIYRNPEGEFHLLGLGLLKPTLGFTRAVEGLARRREERNLEILDRMNKAGIPASYDEIVSMGDNTGGDNTGVNDVKGNMAQHSIGRPHFAAFLVKKKIVRNRQQAFNRYLARGKPFYIPKVGMEFENAVELIHQSGGIAVLAHPMSLYIAWGRLPDLIKDLKQKGLDGLEAWHPAAKASACKRLEELGRKLALIITAGSDFHGEARPDRKLGITAGGKKISESFLEGIQVIWAQKPTSS